MAHLYIGEWQNAYQIPAGCRLRPGLDADLDRLAPRLAESLAEAADHLLGAGGEVVLVPALVLDCTVDAGCPTERVLRHWSGQLALALADALSDPASGVVRFPSRAAFAAAFVADLVRGRAWGRWWYRGFEGLRVLPAGAAIRTLVSADAQAGRSALALVEEGLWPALAQVLGTREAVRILGAWQAHGEAAWHGASGEGGAADRLGGAPPTTWAWPALPPPLLALYLLVRRFAEPWDPAPVGLACWLATLLSRPAEIPTRELARLTVAGDPRARPLPSSESDPDWLALLAGAPDEARRAAARIAAAARPAAGSGRLAPPAHAPWRLPAPFGGLVWLLPAFLDLMAARPGGEPTLAAALPPPPAGADWTALDAAALLTLAILAGDSGPAVRQDPFWCAVLRLPPTFDAAVATRWLAVGDPAGTSRALAAALRTRALGAPVLLRPRLGADRCPILAERGCAGRLHPGQLPAEPAVAPQPIPFRERLALTRVLTRDMRTLAAAPACAELPAAWRDLFATLAQGTLRRTANRIPGAARSSLPYLFANVLGAGGEGETREDGPAGHWTLDLGRPPLHVLLAINGMARLRLDWPGGRHLAVSCSA